MQYLFLVWFYMLWLTGAITCNRICYSLTDLLYSIIFNPGITGFSLFRLLVMCHLDFWSLPCTMASPALEKHNASIITRAKQACLKWSPPFLQTVTPNAVPLPRRPELRIPMAPFSSVSPWLCSLGSAGGDTWVPPGEHPWHDPHHHSSHPSISAARLSQIEMETQSSAWVSSLHS